MLDFIYWPVSFVMWCWHKVFGFVLGDDNAIAWALSIVFLVFTLRAILLKPMVHQIRSMRKMQEFQPQIKAIQKKYANDRQRQAQEMQKLQREHGFNPVGGCLPMVFQIPVFIGLNHVIRNFRADYGSNYFFPKGDITSYLHADLFGVHLNSILFNAGLLGTYGGGAKGFHWEVAPVAIPLMIVASIATHFTARLSVQRQQAMGTTANQPGGELMQKVQLYLFPLGVLVFGGALPVGLLLYWLSNNCWTLGQQHFVFRRMDREEEQKKQEALAQRQALAPKPGQKPNPQAKQPANQDVTSQPNQETDAADKGADKETDKVADKQATGKQATGDGKGGQTTKTAGAKARGTAKKAGKAKSTSASGKAVSNTDGAGNDKAHTDQANAAGAAGGSDGVRSGGAKPSAAKAGGAGSGKSSSAKPGSGQSKTATGNGSVSELLSDKNRKRKRNRK